MTVQDALEKTQGRSPLGADRSAVRYAETMIKADERILVAVSANITARRGHFPGVVVLTDWRVLAVCGLPGIKRVIELRLDALEKREESPSLLRYKALFQTKEDGFTLTVDPETGERFSRCLTVLDGRAEEFDEADGIGGNGILNPLLARNLLRKRRTMEKEKARRKAGREAAAAQFTAESNETETVPQAVAARLMRELEETAE